MIQSVILEIKKYQSKKRSYNQIIVVTSGIDINCEKLNRSELNQYAKQNGVDFTLNIISVGDVSDSDQKALEAYSKGTVQNVTNSENLAKQLETIFNNYLRLDIGIHIFWVNKLKCIKFHRIFITQLSLS